VAGSTRAPTTTHRRRRCSGGAWFAAHPRAHALRRFDAEELGLAGAEAFVDDPPLARDRIAIDVNFDMLSRNDRNEIYAAGLSHHAFLRPMLDEVRRRSAVKVQYGHDQKGADLDDWTDQSDHGPFARARSASLLRCRGSRTTTGRATRRTRSTRASSPASAT
jgi:Zn-dependent M28 family amino/carboxypeptidase